jgi:DNA-binding NtrC family response regulator
VGKLLTHGWPYNVRDLQSLVSLLADQPSPVRLGDPARDKLRADRKLALTDLPPAPDAEADPAVRWPEDAQERVAVLHQLLEQCKGNVSQVARLIGKRHTSVRRWIDKYGVDLRRYRA